MSRPFRTDTRLGLWMSELGMSVRRLSDLSGVNERTLSDYLADRRPMLPKHLTAICQALGVEPEWITGPARTETDPPSQPST